MNYRYLLVFVGGFLTGGLTACAVTKKYYEKKAYEKADEEIQDFITHYDEELNRYYNVDADERDELAFVNPEEEPEREESVKTDYTKFYSKEDPAEAEHPMDDGEDEQYGDTIEEQEANLYHHKNKGRPPKILGAEDVIELPAHIENVPLFYYAYDGVLTDEDDNILEHPEYFVGNCLEKYDFVNSDEMQIYVMNYAMDVCYDVQKVKASFT